MDFLAHPLYSGAIVRNSRAVRNRGLESRLQKVGGEDLRRLHGEERAAITERGCGYTLEIQRRHAARAMQACRAGGVLPVKVLFVSDDGMQEVAL